MQPVNPKLHLIWIYLIRLGGKRDGGYTVLFDADSQQNYAPCSDEDEDGDRITVRSDEELAAMMSYVCIWPLIDCM